MTVQSIVVEFVVFKLWLKSKYQIHFAKKNLNLVLKRCKFMKIWLDFYFFYAGAIVIRLQAQCRALLWAEIAAGRPAVRRSLCCCFGHSGPGCWPGSVMLRSRAGARITVATDATRISVAGVRVGAESPRTGASRLGASRMRAGKIYLVAGARAGLTGPSQRLFFWYE